MLLALLLVLLRLLALILLPVGPRAGGPRAAELGDDVGLDDQGLHQRRDGAVLLGQGVRQRHVLAVPLCGARLHRERTPLRQLLQRRPQRLVHIHHPHHQYSHVRVEAGVIEGSSALRDEKAKYLV